MPRKRPAANESAKKSKRTKIDNQSAKAVKQPLNIDYEKLTAEILKQQNGSKNQNHVETEESTESTVAQSSGIVDQSNSPDIRHIISTLINQIFNTGEPAKPMVSHPISLSDGIPLGAVVAQRTKQKIWENQYIDLRVLLQQREDPVALNITAGSVTIQQQGSAKPKISLTINQSTDALLIFIAIYLEKAPNQALHLLKYCFFIREMHKMLGEGAWRIYDENFRQLKETVNVPWQKPIEELRIKAVTYVSRPAQQPFRKGSSRAQMCFCYAFNNGEQCQNDLCLYSQTCHENHSRTSCRGNKKNKSSNIKSRASTASGGISAPNTSYPRQAKLLSGPI
ncbi:uncharacterized protein LOC130051107 [Ostrea edulis]|uniref:uncharacterized protein LOC130051107 n=1 Tax=Ostrea edulis TaxID=37623 RepID=UPI0024AFBEF9|nr:uncharacterized protein LOC130051107 [Ostrea edulis]